MLDINLFREEKGGDPEVIRQSQRARYARVEDVDDVIALDKRWRDVLKVMEKERGARAKIQKQIGEFKKKKEDPPAELMALKQAADAKIDELAALENEAAQERDALVKTIGNLVHESVPVNDNEDFNDPVFKTCEGDKPEVREGLLNHVDLMKMLDMFDTERGTTVAGGRGYFLKNDGVLLNQALQSLAISHLVSRGFDILQTPFFMKKEMMAQCAQLDEFHEALYKVVEKDGDEESIKYLIATSEQPLACYHANESINEAKFPMRYAGLSTCFRKEAGKHGRDTGGIFRTHQFEKVEQFVYSRPEDSWEAVSYTHLTLPTKRIV
eukprot:TRINITY_DN8779_c0_g1_i5.p1 TRINITY_DN8779_c0_g1~~TRINITY_DN8779_c0_g1_i5.p1  ORF type:complete len:325 (+),score=109.56 TRINITY_DN8779_c0_g1_i5:253-1227(+)